jgi:hypothetical protein
MALINCYECGKDVSTEAAACPNCGAKPKPIDQLQPVKATPIQAIAIMLLVGLAAWFFFHDSNDKAAVPAETKQDVPNNAQPSIEATAVAQNNETQDILANAKTLGEAIDLTQPDMADFSESDFSQGAVKLALWSSDKMVWSELQKIEQGKYGLVMKESDSQRGKRICTNGQVIEIVADKSVPNKIYLGGLTDANFHVYRFIAVGSTGNIVAGSNVKFCGIVTGRNDYANSIGGVAHAIHLVGMFDLPENKK